ncbi:MAG: FtsW/RodA/SpoVE family cell cycle protein [Clostridiales bacterium]|nr:FtsW/RodA/SpoVE family cell cycle protein [Clostridiales bacterium]
MDGFLQSLRQLIMKFLSSLHLAEAGNSLLGIFLWSCRLAMAVLAVWLLIRCCRSLFAGKTEREVWGFLSLANGTRYDLNHWENVIGRAKNCDIRINFPSVSRSHAALMRDDTGVWRIYPLNPKSGVLLNGERIFSCTEVRQADVIAVGGVEMYFFPASQDDEQKQAQKRMRPGGAIRPAGSLWLLTLIQGLMALQFLPENDGSPRFPVFFSLLFLCILMWGMYFLYRAMHRTAYETEAMVFFLITLCFGVIGAYDSPALYKQFITVIFGIILFLALSVLLRNLRLAVKARWPIAAAAAALLAFNVLFGETIFGASNWVSIGPISFQPSEFVKIAFILAGAATLDRLFAKRNLIFTVLFSAFCVGCLALMSDFGTALIFFAAFLCIAFLRTGDLPSIVMIVAAAAFGGGIILRFKPYIADRFSAWRHAWEFAQTTGYQQTRTMSAAASGGLFGVGPTNGWLKDIAAANTDLVFGVICEEFGLILALCAIAVLVILAVFTVKSAATARSSFYTIASSSAMAMLLFQTMLNVFGAVDLLPLTGVTFPFVSMGGSSMIACWGLLTFLKASDTRQNASFLIKLPKKKKAVSMAAPADDAPPSTDFFDEIPGVRVDDIFRKEQKPPSSNDLISFDADDLFRSSPDNDPLFNKKDTLYNKKEDTPSQNTSSGEENT